MDDQLFDAARNGDVGALAALLDRDPAKLHARAAPYGWSLLHAAAHEGHVDAVDFLLRRGMDPNLREEGDNSYPMHWAAAAGHLAVVERLAAAGGDVVGHGDDHDLEVIGWATCWDGGDDEAHRAVADLLLSRGARHHIFSAIAMNRADEVRRIVAADPSSLNRRQSRNEDHRTPLHFAVIQDRPDMVALLVALGADPLAVDGSGQHVAAYATNPGIDRPVMDKIREMTRAELTSARRGQRPPRARAIDLLALLSLGDWDAAELLLKDNSSSIEPRSGVLHLMTKRGDVAGVRWLLDRGADPNGRWAHWDAEVTPLHLAARQGHTDLVRALLAAGADPTVRDSKHDADAIGWAEFFGQPDVVRILQEHRANKP